MSMADRVKISPMVCSELFSAPTVCIPECSHDDISDTTDYEAVDFPCEESRGVYVGFSAAPEPPWCNVLAWLPPTFYAFRLQLCAVLPS